MIRAVRLINVRRPLVPAGTAVMRQALAPRLAVVGITDDVRSFPLPHAVVTIHPLVTLSVVAAVDVCPSAFVAGSRTRRWSPTAGTRLFLGCAHSFSFLCWLSLLVGDFYVRCYQ